MFHAPQIVFKKICESPKKRLSVWWKSRFLEHAASSPPCPRNWKSFVLFNLKSLLFFVPALQQLQPPFFAISLVSMSGLSNFLALSICFVEDHFTFNISFVSICSLFPNLPQKCHGHRSGMWWTWSPPWTPRSSPPTSSFQPKYFWAEAFHAQTLSSRWTLVFSNRKSFKVLLRIARQLDQVTSRWKNQIWVCTVYTCVVEKQTMMPPKKLTSLREKVPLLLEKVKTDTLVLWYQLMKGTVMELGWIVVAFMVHYKSLQRKIYNFFLVLVNIVFVCNFIWIDACSWYQWE